MKTTLNRILVYGIMLAVCLPQLAAAPVPTIVQVQGKVVVNGKVVTQNSTAFPGDQFQTDRTSTASLTGQGMRATLWQLTAAGLEENALTLACGKVDLSTVKNTVVRVNGNNIAPVDPNAKYSVTHRNGNIEIASQEGRLNITEPNGAVQIVNSGGKMNIPTTTGMCPFQPFAATPYWIGAGTAAGAGLVAYCGVVEDWWRKRITPSCF